MQAERAGRGRRCRSRTGKIQGARKRQPRIRKELPPERPPKWQPKPFQGRIEPPETESTRNKPQRGPRPTTAPNQSDPPARRPPESPPPAHGGQLNNPGAGPKALTFGCPGARPPPPIDRDQGGGPRAPAIRGGRSGWRTGRWERGGTAVSPLAAGPSRPGPVGGSGEREEREGDGNARGGGKIKKARGRRRRRDCSVVVVEY